MSDACKTSRRRLSQEFGDPPLEYGPVDGWWWEAGRLDKERMRWQLEELKDKGVAGTWFYARYLYDEPLASDPRYFSDAWWEFTRFAAEEQQRLGLRNFFSNWTQLEFEQDAIRAQRETEPQLWGRRLAIHQARSHGEGVLRLQIPPGDELLDAAAYRADGDALDHASRVALGHEVVGGRLDWHAPDAGWHLTAVVARPWDLDYLSPEIGNRWTDVVLGEYERRVPGLLGKALEAFGPDELRLLYATTLFSEALRARLATRIGFDPTPYLVGLFHEIGERTEQIRSNYYDVMCDLLESNLYQAPTRWLHERGMRYASVSQNGAVPVAQTFHYGDFIRYLRSLDIPGNEDPGTAEAGDRRFLHCKLSSSVAHLYGSGRAVVLCHYASGWGHTLEENVEWTRDVYAKGMNFYSRHLGSYSLMGGWYEWVPPSDHFHHPYWRYWKHFSDYVRRLSFILSQGEHRPDVALLYPISTIHAHWTAGKEHGQQHGVGDILEATLAAHRGLPKHEAGADPLDAHLAPALRAVFGEPAHEASRGMADLAEAIYKAGIDFDIVDNAALAGAAVTGDVLQISGVEFRSILLPPVTTIPIGVIETLWRFYEAGGTVVAFGRLPDASVENGRGDRTLRSLIHEIFGVTSGETVSSVVSRRNRSGGTAIFVPDDVEEVPGVISAAIERDFVSSQSGLFHTHQTLGDVDIYYVFNTEERERDVTVRLRVDADIEVWDPFTGDTRPAHRVRRHGSTTDVTLSMGIHDGVVLVCAAGESRASVDEDNLTEIVSVVSGDAGAVALHGFAESGGRKYAAVELDGEEFRGEVHVEPPPRPHAIEGPLSFRLEPTMDNRWGDFRYPPSNTTVGAEARRFRYRAEGDGAGIELGWHSREFDDSDWPEVTYTHGPYWLHLGPFAEGAETEGTLARALAGDVTLDWTPVVFSKRFGSERQSFRRHGARHLLGVSENFLVLDQGSDPVAPCHHYLATVVEVPEDADYTFVLGRQREHERISLHASARKSFDYRVPDGTQLWIEGDEIPLPTGESGAELETKVHLSEGRNAVLLKLTQPDDAPVLNYAVFHRSAPPPGDPYVPSLRWFSGQDQPIYDVVFTDAKPVSWYRFPTPPGVRRMRLRVRGRAIEAWVDGRPVEIEGDAISLPEALPTASVAALRVEPEVGSYGGAVFEDPVEFECDEGLMPLGDWSEHGLSTYSGIGVYHADFQLTAAQLENRVLLDVGKVRSVAELTVNDKAAGVRIARPFRFDITDYVVAGTNRIEVRVANTLANHMSSYPTTWVFEGQTQSGLLGPMQLVFQRPVRLTLASQAETG